MPDSHGAVELGPKGLAASQAGAASFLRPPCTYIDPYTNAQCRVPAHYEFELDPRHWPGIKPPIIQWACQRHGKDARTLTGLVYIKTL